MQCCREIDHHHIIPMTLPPRDRMPACTIASTIYTPYNLFGALELRLLCMKTDCVVVVFVLDMIDVSQVSTSKKLPPPSKPKQPLVPIGTPHLDCSLCSTHYPSFLLCCPFCMQLNPLSLETVRTEEEHRELRMGLERAKTMTIRQLFHSLLSHVHMPMPASTVQSASPGSMLYPPVYISVEVRGEKRELYNARWMVKVKHCHTHTLYRTLFSVPASYRCPCCMYVYGI